MRFLFVFLVGFISMNYFGQSKKEQIETLNKKVDSLNNVLITERIRHLKNSDLLLAQLQICSDSLKFINKQIEKLKLEIKSYKYLKIGNLDIMTEDLGKMSWAEANKACKELGDGWRLPTIEEYSNSIFKNKSKIPNLGEKGCYGHWSGSEYDNFSAWSLFFDKDFTFSETNYKTYELCVRLVRNSK
jgi:hypothetical protein